MKQAVSVLFSAFLFISSIIFASTSVHTQITHNRKKIIIFTSHGGYGHMSACSTLKHILSDHDVSIINPSQEIFPSLDVIRWCTWGKYNGEDFYNTMLANGWTRTLNFISYHFAMYLIHKQRKRTEKCFYAYFKQSRPDLIISTIPLFNYPAINAAQQHNIPYILITLDADLTFWLLDLEKCKYPHFLLTVGTKTPRIAEQLAMKKLPKEQIREIGAPPLRKDFFEPKDIDLIKKQWHIPVNKPVIMLVRGGSGSHQLIYYLKNLLTLNIPVHILVCIGRNKNLIDLIKKAEKKAHHNNISLTIVPFTERISDLLAVTDVVITQPSPNLCNEAMHFGIPILIDNTIPALFWEQATVDLINLYGHGTSFSNMQQLPLLVKQHLRSKKQPLHNTSQQASQFDLEIKNIVNQML